MTPALEDWVQRARAADIAIVAERLGAKLKRHGRENTGPCPTCGGRDRFSINLTKRVFNCRGSRGGDVIAMVEHVLARDFRAAVEWITGEQSPGGGGGADPRAEEEARRRQEAAERKAAVEARREVLRKDSAREEAYRWWLAAAPINGTAAETYLRARGIDFDLSPFTGVLRFSPGMPYPFGRKGEWVGDRGEVFPVLLCAVQHYDGRFRGVWRIFLRADGRDKAPVAKPKLGRGPCVGGGVWLGRRSGPLNACEGLETGLGIVGILGGKETVVATLSTAGMTAFDPPEGTPITRYWPDGDADRIQKGKDGSERWDPSPGRRAAEAACGRQAALGRRAAVQAAPTMGRDFLDVYAAMRAV